MPKKLLWSIAFCLCLAVSGCGIKVPFIGEDVKTYKVKCIDKLQKKCYVSKGEDPCEACANVICKGGKK